MRRWAVSPSLPPAAFAAATLGLGVAPPQARTLASSATSPPFGHCSPPCPRPRRRRSLCSSSSAASAATTALAVEEARRGRKQLGMDPPLYDYLLSNVREHPVRLRPLPLPLSVPTNLVLFSPAKKNKNWCCLVTQRVLVYPTLTLGDA